MTLVLRDASLADMGALREVFRRSALAGERDRQTLLANPEVLELADAGVRQGRTRVAISDGTLVGFATALDGDNVIEIEDLFVDPDWMGQGIGRVLVHDLVESARRRAHRWVEVTANHDAVGFYERVGFVVDGQVQTQFGPAPRMHLDVTE